jgi:UDP-3-O-[3-hydroxymyristoyl] glucosamine N-acyltransferase
MKAGRCLVLGNLDLPARSLFEEDLVATGQVRIGEGSMLLKSVKSGKDLTLEDGVVVQGAVASGRALFMGRGCRIGGPLLAERRAKIGAGCMIGSEESPTTFSAEEVEMGTGSVVHGTVWAHGCGQVRGAAESRKVHSA